MNWIKKYEIQIGTGLIALIMIGIACTLSYLRTTEASNDPKVQRKFRLTLITGDKKDQAFLLNKKSDVWVESHKGSYWFKGTWHSKSGWNTKILKAGVIDFEEIK